MCEKKQFMAGLLRFWYYHYPSFKFHSDDRECLVIDNQHFDIWKSEESVFADNMGARLTQMNHPV